MHSESLSAFCGLEVWIAKRTWGPPPPLPEPDDGSPPPSAVLSLPSWAVEAEDEWLLEVLVVVTFATPGLGEPPPQPATRMPAATSAASAVTGCRIARRRRRSVTVS